MVAAYHRDGLREGVDRMLWTDVANYLPGDLLVKMDRMSMAHGLEARSPFLDTAVVEFGASLPDRLRMRFGRGKGCQEIALPALAVMLPLAS